MIEKCWNLLEQIIDAGAVEKPKTKTITLNDLLGDEI